MKKATVRRTLSALLAFAMVMSLFTTVIADEPADATNEDTSVLLTEEDDVQSGEIINNEESELGQLTQSEDADAIETVDADAVAIEDDEPYVELSEDHGAYDNAVIVGVALFYGILFIISAIMGDILMAVMDPRISYTSKAR